MFQYNFEDILFRGRENLKNMNVRDTPFLPFKIKYFPKPFLSTTLHTHTDIYSKFHVSNFNSQDILFYYIIPTFYPFMALEIRISKNAEITFQVFVWRIFQYNFEDDILFCGRENVKNINIIDTPFLPFKIKFFSKPFLGTPLRTHTDISSKLHVSNFNSQDILFYTNKPPFYPFVPFKFEFRKNAEIGFQVFL